ncbi:zinc-ribbon domain-containing protein [Agromyces sp. Leaf222]|uniref:zinc-ribbon domain-containing protein n=1 Tax=Agromyces sp. Leaf222 TaxID=1735688 RepID=UPI000A3DDF32|nr:zinc-ribbon domain-containing protein [Agromyces sp. Leaf222]
MRCRICGAALPDGAMFCGHCGSSTSATPESRRRPDPRPGDTTSLGPGFRRSGVVSVPVGLQGGIADVAAGREDGAAAGAGEPVPGDPGAAGAGSGASATSASSASSTGGPPRFVLRFGTGEVRVVFGTGLIGRRPLPQPGESFDHLVQVEDPARSVSKTHLEFGTHEGTLWIADRFSANGTIVRRSDDVIRCEPGRRYLISSGTVVELADQSFTLS